MGAIASCPEDIEGAVKCPKCGFVSHPGIEQCKKCGHHFVAAAAPQSSSGILSIVPPLPPRPPKEAPPPEEDFPPNSPASAEPEPPATFEVEPLEPPEISAQPATEAGAPAVPWREELNDRLEDFRRKRGRVQSAFDPFFPKGLLCYWKSTYVEELGDPLIDAVGRRDVGREIARGRVRSGDEEGDGA